MNGEMSQGDGIAERERERYRDYIEASLQLYLNQHFSERTCVVFSGYWGEVVVAVQAYPASWYFYWENVRPLPVEVAMNWKIDGKFVTESEWRARDKTEV
jgi:hypothetical protein